MKGKALTPEERKNFILERIKIDGRVRVAELSKQLSTSEVTIRSDLMLLDKDGLLERVHGGAIQSLRQSENMGHIERLKLMKEEKIEVAQKASTLVADGDTIVINSGTTTYYFSHELKGKKNLKVLTNSLPIANELAYFPNIQVILLGGMINYHYSFITGDDAIRQINRYRVGKAILCVDGIDCMAGLTTYHQEEAELCRKMLERAQKRIVITDHTKLGRQSFTQVTGIDEIDQLIVDGKADEKILERFRKRGIEVF